MNRITVSLLAALDAVITLGVGVAIPLVPLTVLWGLRFDVTASWLPYWRGAGDIWLLGHGVDVTATLDPSMSAQFGLAGTTVFTVSIAALGIALLTAVLGSRTGRRAWATPHPFTASVAGIVTFAVLSALVTLSAHTGAIVPSLLQGSLVPAAVFALGIGVGLAAAETQDRTDAPRGDRSLADGSLTGRVLGDRNATGRALGDHGRDGRDDRGDARVLMWPFDRWSPATRAVLAAGVRAGVAASALIIAAGAVLFAALLVMHYGRIIGLYESLQPGVLGAAALTMAQLAFLPNAVIWTASWLIGPGFSLGTGTAVDVTQTTLGPLPSVPLFGALPQSDPALGIVAVLVPVLCGAVAGVLTRLRLQRMPAPRSSSTLASVDGWSSSRLALVVVVTAATAAGILGLLAWWSSGAIGPGRLQQAGPNGLFVGGLAGAEVLVGAAIGIAVRRRPDEADVRLSLRERRAAERAPERASAYVPARRPSTASIASMVSAVSARAGVADADDTFDTEELRGDRSSSATSVTEPVELASLIEARTRSRDDGGADRERPDPDDPA
ncbi:DUF6350 family protein [Humibacter albus]|uniref:cell division protein PerM n=1 Tax=Humibacter albus TaxID=427754 RepID=UPI0003B6C1B6|nr:DUF6350 family protein [Humibacter albus]